jgi:hypothetical protein
MPGSCDRLDGAGTRKSLIRLPGNEDGDEDEEEDEDGL